MNDKIEREVMIDAPMERVWELVTTAEHLGTWFGDDGADVDLRPGGLMTLRWAEYGEVHGRVERVEPPHAFSFRWGDGADPAEDKSTLVEFKLVSEGDGTRVRVVESGFESLAAQPEERLAKFEDNSEGWTIELGHLAEHATKVAA